MQGKSLSMREPKKHASTTYDLIKSGCISQLVSKVSTKAALPEPGPVWARHSELSQHEACISGNLILDE